MRVFCSSCFLIGIVLTPACRAQSDAPENWIAVGNDRGGQRYSALTQINRDNAATLELAWTWHTGELGRERQVTIECTPIVIDGVMYVTTGHRRVVALKADTGQPIWDFDPDTFGKPVGPMASGGVNRGCAWWSDGKADGARRILHGTADGRLFSLDATTGVPDPKFGRGGWIALRDGIEWDISKHPYGPTSAPAIFEDLVIMGFSNSEGPPPGAPGDVRVFDVRSGKERWRFHTIARPDEFGGDTWPDGAAKERPGANAWGGMTVDEANALVFVGTGSAGFDFYGGDRLGENLFANCVIALNARTGERVWHYQTLRHDLWDHDLPVYPNLVTVQRDGKNVLAAAQVTKTGFVYVFDRLTGEPLFPMTEVAVEPSTIAGEQAWPTQPVPLLPPPFARQRVDESDLFSIDPTQLDAVRQQFAGMRFGPAWNPPSLEGTICVPGFHGGATWSGASFDPTTCRLFLNSNNMPNVMKLEPTPDGPLPYRFAGYAKLVDKNGYPVIPPPWGQLIAINLNTGAFDWQVPLGEFPELTAMGIAQTGTESFGGTICTAGGLVFIGGTMDEMFRAFDSDTGRVLWESKLPAGGYATPCTYSVNGRQFVCIAAGGAGKLGTRAGDAFVAFALP